MNEEGKNVDLKTRTRAFALRIIRLYVSLSSSQVSQVIGRQMLRSGTSVGAHYREAQRSRSTKEFVSKLDGGRQELEETMYWLELLRDSGGRSKALDALYAETDEWMAILTTCVRNAKRRDES